MAYEQGGDIQVLGTLPCLYHLRYEVMEGAVERCAVGTDAFPHLVIWVFDIWDVWGGKASRGNRNKNRTKGGVNKLQQSYKIHDS